MATSRFDGLGFNFETAVLVEAGTLVVVTLSAAGDAVVDGGLVRLFVTFLGVVSFATDWLGASCRRAGLFGAARLDAA